MVRTEELRARALRAVLATGIAATHVELASARRACAAIPPGCGQGSRDAIGEDLGKTGCEEVKRMRGGAGHMPSTTPRRSISQVKVQSPLLCGMAARCVWRVPATNRNKWGPARVGQPCGWWRSAGPPSNMPPRVYGEGRPGGNSPDATAAA